MDRLPKLPTAASRNASKEKPCQGDSCTSPRHHQAPRGRLWQSAPLEAAVVSLENGAVGAAPADARNSRIPARMLSLRRSNSLSRYRGLAQASESASPRPAAASSCACQKPSAPSACSRPAAASSASALPETAAPAHPDEASIGGGVWARSRRVLPRLPGRDSSSSRSQGRFRGSSVGRGYGTLAAAAAAAVSSRVTGGTARTRAGSWHTLREPPDGGSISAVQNSATTSHVPERPRSITTQEIGRGGREDVTVATPRNACCGHASSSKPSRRPGSAGRPPLPSQRPAADAQGREARGSAEESSFLEQSAPSAGSGARVHTAVAGAAVAPEELHAPVAANGRTVLVLPAEVPKGEPASLAAAVLAAAVPTSAAPSATSPFAAVQMGAALAQAPPTETPTVAVDSLEQVQQSVVSPAEARDAPISTAELAELVEAGLAAVEPPVRPEAPAASAPEQEKSVEAAPSVVSSASATPTGSAAATPTTAGLMKSPTIVGCGAAVGSDARGRASDVSEVGSTNGSWGSADSPERGRSPPLSPLGTAQRHMMRKPIGLQNLGNTCFLNVGLQVLAHTPLLAPFFLRGNFIKDLNAANPLGTGGELASAFAGLLQRLFPSDGDDTNDAGGGGSLAPEELYDVVCRRCPLVGERRGAQQDAHEVLNFLLDALHEDLNRNRRRPPYEERPDLGEEDLSRRGEERYAAKAWHDQLRRHRSIFVDLCQGQLRSQVKCCECGTASVTFDPFLFLSLPLPPKLGRGGKATIEAAIQAFCAEEKLEGDNRWGCPRCKRRVCAFKRLSLWKLPVLLLVHLKRFGFEAASHWAAEPRAWKVEGEVSFPLTRLNLQGFAAPHQRVPLHYDLFGTIDHIGSSPSAGHYTASCRRPDGWWRFDDARAEFLGRSEDAAQSVLGESNYLLAFQRRDAPPEPDLVREQSQKLPENWPHFAGADGAEWSFLDPAASQQS